VIIGVLNGPNLNLLGTREPAVYGTATLADITAHLERVATELGVQIRAAQANGEGQLIDILHGWRGEVDGVVVNAGAYTHTSLALRDAFTATALPFVEVHLSNIHARDEYHRHSKISFVATGVICGLGPFGYIAALHAIANMK